MSIDDYAMSVLMIAAGLAIFTLTFTIIFSRLAAAVWTKAEEMGRLKESLNAQITLAQRAEEHGKLLGEIRERRRQEALQIKVRRCIERVARRNKSEFESELDV